MGMDQTVSFAGRPTPAWAAVADLLARHGFPVQTRMIDGQLALPDEAPPEPWRELRVGTPQGYGDAAAGGGPGRVRHLGERRWGAAAGVERAGVGVRPGRRGASANGPGDALG